MPAANCQRTCLAKRTKTRIDHVRRNGAVESSKNMRYVKLVFRFLMFPSLLLFKSVILDSLDFPDVVVVVVVKADCLTRYLGL